MTMHATSNLPVSRDATGAAFRLSGRSLMVARSAWLLVALAAILTFVLALPFRWVWLTHPGPATLANLNALGLTPTAFAAFSLAWEILFAGAFALTGFIIFWRCDAEPFALFAAGLMVVLGVANGALAPATHALLGRHAALDFLIHTFEFITWCGLALFFYLFPNGRFVPSWTRWLAVAILPLYLLWNYASGPWAPLNWPAWVILPLNGLIWLSWLLSQVYRYRRVSVPVERQQTKWIVFAIVAIIATDILLYFVIGSFVPGYVFGSESQASPQAFTYSLIVTAIDGAISVLLPVALAFSIMRYRLWDLDLVINRVLVYGGLTVLVAGAYVLVVGGLGALFEASGNILISLAATAVVAVLFQPLRGRLQRGVNRLMYGERDDPYAVLSRLGQKLEAALTPDSVLPTLVETIAQALKLPYVAILLRDGSTVEVAAVCGSPTVRPLMLPITYQHQLVGELHVASRAPDEPFTAAEVRLLEDIAVQIGVAIRHVRLTADLQRSREQLVGAREEERRRLRRDLHDGLGPKLAGQTLKLEAALDALDGETDTARTLLQETVSESQTIITEIRRLVYGLRPPALDQLGLLEAIRELAAHYRVAGLQVIVSAPETLPPLPAAVEVAAYRIIQEALTNVARHAQARTCTVSLVLSRELQVEIVDDGRGLPPEMRAGVGLTSMRERAEEIGGSCTVEVVAEAGGTRVTARLPISRQE